MVFALKELIVQREIRHFNKELLLGILMEMYRRCRGIAEKRPFSPWGGRGKHGVGDGFCPKSYRMNTSLSGE